MSIGTREVKVVGHRCPGTRRPLVDGSARWGAAAAVLLWLSLCLPALGQTVTRGPYLQMGTPTSIVVRWRTSAATNSRVRYGTDLASLTGVADDATPTTEHQVRVSGLLPDTQYYYTIGTTSATLAGGDAGHVFVTSPLTGTPKPTRIWVIGDSGTADAKAAAVRNAYTTFTGTRNTDLWLMLGDNAYDDGTDSEYQTAVFNMYPALLRQTVLWPTLGNHDGHSADSATQSGPYYNIFSLPTLGEAGGLASGTEAYYSFDYGNIHCVCLESFETNRTPTGAMLTWLQNDLASTTQQWIIAFWHHPPYSKGSHDSDKAAESIQMRQNALPILEAAGVDLVLCGHSHSYERSFLLDGHYGLSSTLTQAMKKNGGSGRPDDRGAYQKPTAGRGAHEGAVYAVAGSSGKTSGGSLNHPAMFISLNQLGSLVLDVNGNRLDAVFLDHLGARRDYFTIVKGAQSAALRAPSGLAARAVSSSEINLAWIDNAANELGFRIERKTGAAGTYAEIATVNADVTAHPDTGRSAGIQYFYRVRASNAAGTSDYSNEASATTSAGRPAAPAASSNLTATAVSKKQINLTWIDNASNESGFKIERRKGAGSFKQIATVAAGKTSYSNTGCSSNTTYSYRVRAYNKSGNSAFSNLATVRTPR